MNLNYAIFRSEPIMTTQDLSQIGSHNKREKQAYKSNPDIQIEFSKDNIELVPLAEKYLKGFDNLTKDYKKEHDERMKTERKSRQEKYNLNYKLYLMKLRIILIVINHWKNKIKNVLKRK